MGGCVDFQDVCCDPGIGFSADVVASIDCVVAQKKVSARGKIDVDKITHREVGLVGFAIITYCLVKNVKGAMIYGIVFVTVVSWFRNTKVTTFPNTGASNSAHQYFLSDATSIVVGSLLGTSPVTMFINSSQGFRRAGGREDGNYGADGGGIFLPDVLLYATTGVDSGVGSGAAADFGGGVDSEIGGGDLLGGYEGGDTGVRELILMSCPKSIFPN
ncbi:hypothetical protein LR48_Vigan45s002300 [Vigna angularis]|uniref:Uncharacterized protein n=2 Tax=Phaseolus angularis TaxID=3914 RepID=A0A0L9T3V8_PHAAN|nr:hypothetical protein LR48_Vigan45s002300 [Vigna angularis]BAT74159.1 hypothetical protein VIGAN_01176900 [Vigna angularis var. angularis]